MPTSLKPGSERKYIQAFLEWHVSCDYNDKYENNIKIKDEKERDAISYSETVS